MAWKGSEPPPPVEEDDATPERAAAPTHTRLSATWTFAALRLLAGAIGALLAVLLAASRLLQLRLAARRHRP
jgi:hypothetical protein